MASTYLLIINGKPQGPFSLDELRAMKVKPGDFVKAPGMDDYKEANEIAELRELLGFSKQAVIPQYFGSFDQRLMACALDWFFVGGACILLAFFATLFVQNKIDRLSIALSTLVLIPPIKLIYNIVMECTAKQATFGKQILKIKVCDMQGNRVSVFRSFGRNFAKLFSVMTFFIGYLLSFFTKQQQCLHDMIAGTLVMKDRLF
jgi:uncharacterized RDD family membrane protein YckC